MTQRRVVWMWWAAYAAFVAFLLLPGPKRNPFSGLPMAVKTQALFLALLAVGLFCLLYPPRRRPSPLWLVILLIAAGAKLALAPSLVETGWKGTYWWVSDWNRTAKSLTVMPFYDFHAIRPYRVDSAIAFKRTSFGFHFLNDLPIEPYEFSGSVRDILYPLRVEWTGYVQPGPVTATVTANGRLEIEVDGRRVYLGGNPRGVPVPLPQLEGPGTHRVRVLYTKPPDTEAAVTVAGIEGVLPQDLSSSALVRSQRAEMAITVTGILALLALASAFAGAYKPLSRFFLEDVWESRAKIAVLAFVAVFLFLGLKHNVAHRGTTEPLLIGDDFLAYEGQARQILHNGLLMTDRHGFAEPYFFYPLYSYALAGAHGLFGEDFGTIILFNFLCLASLGPLMWLMLRRRTSEGVVLAILVVLGVTGVAHFAPYALTAFTDNLYLPMVLLAILAFVAAFERPSAWRFAVVGAITALGAATRPSFMIFAPFAVLAILFERRLGNFWARLRRVFAFGLGFAAGVSPFTIRNWIVSHRFVLLVASFIMVPTFMFAPGEPVPDFHIQGEPPGFLDTVRQSAEVISARPLHVLGVELRKIGFTLGLTSLGPPGGLFPWYFVLTTLLFAFALWARRIPWAVRNALVAFALSHLAAVVIATPWTYGYKTILPLHMAFLIGIAFLLPSWGTIAQVDLHRPRDHGPGKRPTVSVVLPTYNEKDSIRGVILDFFATGVVDEVLVVNNNAAPGTSEEVAGTGAREVHEPEQGYGAACQRGLRDATGDYIVLCEPDGTFAPDDIFKLLAYADDFDVVYGSRTSQQFVWQGANMGFFLRFGNWAVAKYMELLFNGPNLTDVGCTMRLLKRQVAEQLRPQFRIKGSQFGPEMMVLTLRHRYRMVQIPVNYKARVGVSAVTGDPGKALSLGLKMIWLITQQGIVNAATPESPGPASSRAPT